MNSKSLSLKTSISNRLFYTVSCINTSILQISVLSKPICNIGNIICNIYRNTTGQKKYLCKRKPICNNPLMTN